MALSPNYGWSEPDNSSLVKNGAADIRTLGDAIDTSVWNSGFGQAGKNKIINGDFAINQRSFTSTTTSGTFGFDRFRYTYTGGTATYSAQTFTAGAAPVVGYEAANFARLVTTGQSAVGDFCYLIQTIEDVRTFAGQTATVSFWAKASTGTPNVGISLEQVFGSGGSALVIVNGGVKAITTSWTRYSVTVAVPSISGKTIGTSNRLAVGLFTSAGTSISGAGYPAVGIQNATIDFWGVQVEYGSKATPFQTASGGNPQAELAMCQRYYYRNTAPASFNIFATGIGRSTSQSFILMPLPVTLRTNASSVDYANVTLDDGGAVYTVTALTLTGGGGSPNSLALIATSSATLVPYRPYFLDSTASIGYVGVSAEL